MTLSLLSPEVTFIQLTDHIEYPQAGVLSKILMKDTTCQCSLFCLSADTEISEHTATRNATVQVLEGKGMLTLADNIIPLEPGVVILMPANIPHALTAASDLAFLLTLSALA